MKNVNEVTDKEMEVIAAYMDGEKREKVHFKFAPCTNELFLKEYCKIDPEFVTVLENEFSVEL